MGKPRVIIADSDFGYIIPLQLKFAEQFHDKIDLEIICDPDYFAQLFTTPQKADILVVSEDLYDTTIRKHSIAHIFLMTEQQEEGRTTELDLDYIFKYTSIMGIYSAIIGKSLDVLPKGEVTKEPQIVMVYSACGGVGKTTIALGISSCLARNYKKVLYLNAGRLQSFQRLLDNQSPISASDVYAKLANPSGNIYSDIQHVIRSEKFSYLPPFRASLMSLGLKYSVFERIALAAKESKDYDFVVVDADTTFDEDNASLMNVADKVVVVTEQHSASVYATNNLVANINGVNGEKFFFICNKFDKDDSNALISPSDPLKFTVSDYVDQFLHYDQMKCDELAQDSGIQRTAVLVM